MDTSYRYQSVLGEQLKLSVCPTARRAARSVASIGISDDDASAIWREELQYVELSPDLHHPWVDLDGSLCRTALYGESQKTRRLQQRIADFDGQSGQAPSSPIGRIGLALIRFYRATQCVSAVFAVARCPSVCPSRSCIVAKWLKISSNFFLAPVAPSF